MTAAPTATTAPPDPSPGFADRHPERLDELMPVGNGMRLTRLVPGGRYVELPGVGHLVPLEAPDALADVIEEQ